MKPDWKDGAPRAPQDLAARMAALVRRLNETAYQYYVLNAPTIADSEWDAMYDELSRLEAETGEVLADSPTRRVGSEPSPAFAQHRHRARLWSLDKAQSMEALREWARRMEKLRAAAVERGLDLPPLRFLVEDKFDGLTINLTYEDGLLVQAATRGNGEVGEAILAQARTIRSLPMSIDFAGRMEVHGEGYMRISTLAAYNASAAEPLKNPRNAAAGALRNLDPGVTAARRLDACMYDVGYIEGASFAGHEQMLQFLKENRFPTSGRERWAEDIEQAIEYIRVIEEERATLDYMIDGAVVKIDDFATCEALGYTDKFPRWAIAYKFEAEEATTKLLNVTWEVGRTGKLTPLAHLAPVQLAGATIARATLNNWGDIQRKRVRVGARVWIRRSNEVIPEIMGRVEEYEPDERDVERPDRCPACDTALIEKGAHIFCPNRDGCVPQIAARLTHYASRDAMNIDAFSEKTALQLHRSLGVCEPSDLYGLAEAALAELPRFAAVKARNLVRAIDASRDCTLDRLIHALGVPNVGRKTARDLAVRFGAIERLMEARYEELVTVNEVGDIVAASVVDYFADAANRAEIERLLAAGVRPRPCEAADSGPLTGMTVVITGTLPTLTRQQAEEMARAAGAKAASAVSKKTSFVVAGEGAGSKLERARALGIEVIDEAEFTRRTEGKL